MCLLFPSCSRRSPGEKVPATCGRKESREVTRVELGSKVLEIKACDRLCPAAHIFLVTGLLRGFGMWYVRLNYGLRSPKAQER